MDIKIDTNTRASAGSRASKTRLIKETGTDKYNICDELTALADWPGLYLLGATVDRVLADKRQKVRESNVRARGGRRQTYPTAVFLLAIFGARVTGSEASALTELRKPATWTALGEVWRAREENTCVPFPFGPPNRDQVRHFRQHLQDPQMLEELQGVFQQVAVAQAKGLGNFDPDAPIDWTRPDLRHTVIGDGMVLQPFSEVRLVHDPVAGGVRALGSRPGVTRPRVSPGSDLDEDGKSHLRGINHVVLHTPTPYGPVVLATGPALRAEIWAALDLFDQLAARLDGAVHNLLWDRIFTGRHLDYMMGKHRVRVFNKAAADNDPGRKVTETSSSFRLQRAAADEHLQRLNDNDRFTVQLADTDTDANQRSERERAGLFSAWRTEELYRIWFSNAPQPLGISLYRATSAKGVTGSRNQRNGIAFDTVRSRFRHVKVETHTTVDGPCVHDLYVDDGALHSVVFDGDLGCYVKVATATCVRSTWIGRPAARWGSKETWLMPCPKGNFEITTEWEPHATRPRPDTESPKSVKDPVLTALRPISRSQAQAFADIANHRNGAESWNNWYQRRLPIYGRAASLSVEGQMLDLLAGGCVRNAITWTQWLIAD